ncbi:MAG: RHS repeat-associated core domain-containing protein [Lachnospiraceae bacterium]|nr:RHS repeat-associated core domain-containing protein [Lachnospiraceae bacterium]
MSIPLPVRSVKPRTETETRYSTVTTVGKVSERTNQLEYVETFKYDEEGNLSLHIDRDDRRLQRDCNVFGKRIRYTGQQYDEFTEQYYLRARYYNPVLGRFMQEDVYQGDGLNLYAYCGNNPVIYDDLSGYAKKKVCGNNGETGNGVTNPDDDSSAVPVPERTTASNGLDYQSNDKHTLGQPGNNRDSGIEPRNSLELFGNSVESEKNRVRDLHMM